MYVYEMHRQFPTYIIYNLYTKSAKCSNKLISSEKSLDD